MTLSAGILIYRRRGGAYEFFLVHPGGPYWKNRDMRAWSIPKGLCDEEEDPRACALRELKEETGFSVAGKFLDLGTFRQRSGKLVRAFACEGDCDPGALRSNLFEMEWPPHSGRRAKFREVDRGGWFGAGPAREKLVAGQRALIDKCLSMVEQT